MAAQTQTVTGQPLVSVIMSVYNGERFLHQAIDSIFAQTYSYWEFIIIDDASTDSTSQILSSYNDNRIRIFTNDEQKGLTANLNKAISIATGKFIARMDADDVSLPERLEKQVSHLTTHPTLAGVAAFVDFIDETNEVTGFWKLDRIASSLNKIKSILPAENCIAHPTVMLRKEVLAAYKYNTNQRHSQDWDLWLRLFSNGLYIDKLNEVLLQYRLHSSSVTHLQKKQSAFQKKNEVYRKYFAWKYFKWNAFNLKVYSYYLLNKLKMIGSNAKRKLIK